MKKYLRAMRSGSSKTKLFLWTIAGILSVSLVCLGASILGAGIGFSYVAFGGVVFSIAYSQLAVFKDVSREIEQQERLEQSIEGRRIQDAQNGSNQSAKKLEEKWSEEGNSLNKYTEDCLKKYFSVYKVKKENYAVLIDSSPQYQIMHCPAYVWSDRNYLFFLLLEKKPRVIHVSRKQTATLHYEKGLVVKDIEEYKKVKNSIFLSSEFQRLYPKYYKNTINGLTTFSKNVFVIGDDIRITTPSARGIMKVIDCHLELTEKQIDRTRFGGYFEEIYKANLLLKEEVYDQEMYDEQIRNNLVSLAEHEEKIEVFQEVIHQLIQYRFISQEYAEFYMDYRGKIEEKRWKQRG